MRFVSSLVSSTILPNQGEGLPFTTTHPFNHNESADARGPESAARGFSVFQIPNGIISCFMSRSDALLRKRELDLPKSLPGSYIVSTQRDFAMLTRIIRIGNSKGIRIPKPLLEQSGLSGDVEINVQDGALVIKPARKPRTGWEAAFKKMAERGDDALLNGATPSLTRWDEDEWEW